MATEEQQYLQAVAAQRQRQLQTDPFARAVNDYGQGSDFLQLDAQPESWDRLGEINDVYSDLFRTTGTYLQDFVPGLYPEAEDPGLYTGYKSDRADLYRNNPAYAQLEQFMAEGAPFDEAVQLVTKLAATNPQIASGLPQYENRPDQQAFRTSAESYISERAREGREFDEYDARRQQYEDYVNPQTGWGLEADKTEDITPFLRKTDVLESPEAARVRERPETLPELIQARSRINPETTSLPPARVRANIRAINDPEVKAKRKNDETYNKALQDAYSQLKGKKEARLAPSKKQQNQAKLVQAYNMLMYGE